MSSLKWKVGRKLKFSPSSSLGAIYTPDPVLNIIYKVTPGHPFSVVSVVTFGPWSIVTRKTRGGVADWLLWLRVWWQELFTSSWRNTCQARHSPTHYKNVLPSVEALVNCDLTVAQTSFELPKILTKTWCMVQYSTS